MSSIRISNRGRTITFRGAAARSAFEGITGKRILRANYSQKTVNGVAFLVDKGFAVTITNDAEAVVQHVAQDGIVRIIYKDTDGRWDELKFTTGGDRAVFTGFAPLSDQDRMLYRDHLV